MLRSNTRVKQPGKEPATPDFSLKQERSDWKVTRRDDQRADFTRSELGHPISGVTSRNDKYVDSRPLMYS